MGELKKGPEEFEAKHRLEKKLKKRNDLKGLLEKIEKVKGLLKKYETKECLEERKKLY